MQGDIRNDSLQGSVKYWSKDLKFGFILDWIVGATEQKKLLNWLAMSFGLVRKLPLLLRIILEDSDSWLFKEIIDLIPFQVFLIYIINVVSEIIIVITFFTLF